MDKFTRLASIALASSALVFTTACSDDDDDPNGGNNGTGAENVKVENVFTDGLPASVDGGKFTLNDKGQLVSYVETDDYSTTTVTFEYGTFSRADEYQVLMKIREDNDPDENIDIYIRLNKQGYAEHALEIYADRDETDTWDFEYDRDGHLTKLYRSESEETFNITYADGNITKVVQVEEDGDRRETSILYTNALFSNPVPNKGNIMLFDETFDVDMDEMSPAYFAGLLGKSVKNVPFGQIVKGVEGGSSYTNTYTLNWTFNEAGFPTSFHEGDNTYDTVYFTWQ